MSTILAALVEAVPAGVLLLIKSALILLAASVVSRAVSYNPRLRSALWRTVYAMLALLPVLQFFLPERLLNLFDLQHAGLSLPIGLGARTVPLVLVLAVLWFVGVFLALLRFGRDWHAAHRLVAASVPLTDARICALFAALPRPRNASLRLSREVGSPSLFGWRQPIIVLPVSVLSWTDNEVRAMLLHELEHAARRDWPVMIAERVLGILYWPNVLIVHAHRSASDAREQLADRAVLRSAITPASYATQLLHLARSGATQPSGALTLALLNNSVEQRVRALFIEERSSRSSLGPSTLVLCAGLTLLPIISALRPWTCVPALAETLNLLC